MTFSKTLQVLSLAVLICLPSCCCFSVPGPSANFSDPLKLAENKFPSCKLTNKDGEPFRKCQTQFDAEMEKSRFGFGRKIKVGKLLSILLKLPFFS